MFHEMYKKELQRLEKDFLHTLRQKKIINPGAGIPMGLNKEANWDNQLSIFKYGTAAAKPDSWEVDFAEVPTLMAVLPGNAVLVVGNGMEPVARDGQWALLADEQTEVEEGDLVAVKCVDNSKLLRRISSHGEEWILKAINPNDPKPDFCVPKTESSLRKVLGVLFDPQRSGRNNNSDKPVEWCPRGDFDIKWLKKLAGVQVLEDSLDPIARDGQHVLIDQTEGHSYSEVKNGDLAVIDSSTEGIGRVIKRVYHHDLGCILTSPNQVDPHPPLLIPRDELDKAKFWVLKGVLFESIDLSDEYTQVD
ncbi:S24 family peptidase [Rubinisphaera italica]|nr:S24 family peptidase [Rubinisphaera italica]